MSSRVQAEFFARQGARFSREGGCPGFRRSGAPQPRWCGLDDALGRVPAESLTRALPGFARATVDDFAVRAADTYGTSDELPRPGRRGAGMGPAPQSARSAPGAPWPIATGAPLPPGADAVLSRAPRSPQRPSYWRCSFAVAPAGGLVLPTRVRARAPSWPRQQSAPRPGPGDAGGGRMSGARGPRAAARGDRVGQEPRAPRRGRGSARAAPLPSARVRELLTRPRRPGARGGRRARSRARRASPTRTRDALAKKLHAIVKGSDPLTIAPDSARRVRRFGE